MFSTQEMLEQMTMGVPAEKEEEEGGSLNEVQIDGHSAIHSQREKDET